MRSAKGAPQDGSSPSAEPIAAPRNSTANGINDLTDGPTNPTADSATDCCASRCQT